MKNLVKTIVFDEFSPTADTLTRIIQSCGDNLKQLTDADLKKIEDKLGVRSFDEFLAKFKIEIYPTIIDNQASWTTDERFATGEGLELDKDFKPLKLFINMMEKRRTSNQSKLEFDWQEALEELSPKSRVEEAKFLRKQLEFSTKELMEIEEKLGTNTPQYKNKAKEILNHRAKIKNIYEKNPLNLLPLAVADTQSKLEYLEASVKDEKNSENQMKLGYHEFDDKGNIKFVEYRPEEMTEENEKESKALVVTEKVQGWLVKDYEVTTKQNTYVKDLILSTFSNRETSLVDLSSINKDELKKRYTQQVELYKNMLEGEYKSLNELFTKLLGIKAYFDQIPSKEKPMLIITNEKIEEIVKRKDAVKLYLDTVVGRRILENKEYRADIWNAIIPGVTNFYNEDEEDEEDDFDIDGAVVLDDSITNEKKSGNHSAVKELIDILSKKVVTFFNFKVGKYTSFENLQKYGIENYEKELEKLSLKKNNDYIVPCYPNFTVIEEEDFRINLGDSGINLKSVYIDAAYVACGVVSSYLDPDNLIDKRIGFDKGEINMQAPGVRIDLEEKIFSRKIRTSIGKESNIGLSTETEKDIQKIRKGFIFTCDEVQDTMYTLVCRNSNGKPLYKVYVLLYLTKEIESRVDGEKNKIKELKNGYIRNEIKANEDKINCILKNGEEIILPIEAGETTIKVRFGEDEEKVEIVIDEE